MSYDEDFETPLSTRGFLVLGQFIKKGTTQQPDLKKIYSAYQERWRAWPCEALATPDSVGKGANSCKEITL